MTFFVEQLNTANEEVERIGEAATLEEAVKIAKHAIDQYLYRHSYYNRSADALFTRYQESGLTPCIFRDDGETLNVRTFDHLDYASRQCVKVCREKPQTILVSSWDMLPSDLDGDRVDH